MADREVGSKVRCTYTMRRAKAYAHIGCPPAQDGDTGVITALHEMRDVIIAVFQTERGALHCHIQNLIDISDC